MKKTALFLLTVFFIPSALLFAQNFKGKVQEVTIAPAQKDLKIGETLNYSVEWIGIPIGKLVLKVEGLKEDKGRQYYHVSARTFPNSFFTRLYDVEYKLDSYIDKKKIVSARFVKSRRIKDVFNEVVIEFDQQNQKATYRHFTPGGKAEVVDFPSMRKEIVSCGTRVVPILPECQDLLSSLYYFRLLEIKENNSYPINMSYGQGKWIINIKVGKPYLKDIHRKGAFGVFCITPKTDLSNLILGKREVKFYFTADSRRIPVLMTFNSAIGQFRVAIKDFPE